VWRRRPGYGIDMPSDLGSGTVFVVLFLVGLGALLVLLTWLEPPHDVVRRSQPVPLAGTADRGRLTTSEAGTASAALSTS
jgi:hypothetical protein